MNSEIEALKQQVEALKQELLNARLENETSYYADRDATHSFTSATRMPTHGLPAKTVKAIVENPF